MSFIDDYSRRCWVNTMSTKESSGVVCGVKEEHGEDYEKEDQDTPFR